VCLLIEDDLCCRIYIIQIHIEDDLQCEKKRNSKIKRKRKITALSSETKEKVLEEIEKKFYFI
jgi:hypothetical protein